VQIVVRECWCYSRHTSWMVPTQATPSPLLAPSRYSIEHGGTAGITKVYYVGCAVRSVVNMDDLPDKKQHQCLPHATYAPCGMNPAEMQHQRKSQSGNVRRKCYLGAQPQLLSPLHTQVEGYRSKRAANSALLFVPDFSDHTGMQRAKVCLQQLTLTGVQKGVCAIPTHGQTTVPGHGQLLGLLAL